MNFFLCFLLLSEALHSSWNVWCHTVVRQSPDVTVKEGETVTIMCCWNKSERVGLQWLKNQTPIKNKTFIIQSEGSEGEKQKDVCSPLVIKQIKRHESGRYVCKITVEIPVLIENEGNGTTVTVTGTGPTENPAETTGHRTANEKEESTDEEAERKTDDSGNTKIVDESVPAEDKETTQRPKEKTADGTIKHIAIKNKEPTSKGRENTKRDAADNGSEEDVFTFVLRSLPVLALITAFFWLYYLGIKAQKHKAASAAPGTKAPLQNIEEEQEEEEEEKKEESAVEEDRAEKGNEPSLDVK